MTPEQRKDFLTFWRGKLAWDVSMAKHSTFRAGGPVTALVDVVNDEELADLLGWLHSHDVPWRVIGRGSNVLVSTRGFAGVIIRLQGNFCDIRRVAESTAAGSDPIIAEAGGGCSIAKMVAWCTGQALTGVEFLAGIPGSIGGAVRMNAGAWGKSIGDCIKTVLLIDQQGRRHEVAVQDVVLSYRSLELRQGNLQDMIITGARCVLRRGRQADILQRSQDNLVERRAKQPAGDGSAGSFFKNPAGDSAGRLIEASGLKGLSCGQAMVSQKHANFIVNTGMATADEITELMHIVQEKVYKDSGILLEPEVHFI